MKVSGLFTEQYFSYIAVVSFIDVEKPEFPEKTDDELYHIMLYLVHLAMSGI
jgi:hypothetical protein